MAQDAELVGYFLGVAVLVGGRKKKPSTKKNRFSSAAFSYQF
jgi:hypothetical protein